jgi:hypothetical protein
VPHQLRFESLRDPSNVLAFSCDACGVADMNEMDAATRNRYLFARALMGIDYTVRCVPCEDAFAFEFDSAALEMR